MIERPDNPEGNSIYKPTRLPKRDYILLPLLSLLTVLVMFGVSEILTRMIWFEQKNNSCTIEDPVDGDRFKPNCSFRGKLAEGPWTIYRYNECGYRSATSCGPKPAGTIRIAILGSSVSYAYHVPYEEAFFSRASSELSRLCDRPVDVQNLGVPGSSPIYAYRRVQEAISLNPDVVLYVVTPFDVEQQIPAKVLAERDSPTRTSSPAEVKSASSPLKKLEHLLLQSRTVLVAQHFIFQNNRTYIRVFMTYGDKADFLRQPFTHAWQQRFADFDLIIGGMADKFHAAGVPLIIIPVPSRVEAALLSLPPQPPHVDPFAFGREIEKIASRHGADYLDLMEPFSHILNAESLYYAVDSHFTPGGHKVIAEKLVQKLQDGSVPAFSHCAP